VTILADTGVLLSAADRSEPRHDLCAEVLRRHRGELVVASIVTVAENLAGTTIATLNDRDFRVVRPAHCDAFELVP
jgi:predicted nucleic acid-binding protein